MIHYKVGYLVGSLATASINRKLAKALRNACAPETSTFTEIPFRDLPLYSYDYDADYPPVAQALKDAHRGRRRRAVRHAGVQPLDPRRTEERDRLGEPALWHQLLHPQAVRRHRHVARRDRHRRRPAEPEERAQLLQFTADERARGLHPVHARADHRRRRGHRRIDGGVPAQLYGRSSTSSSPGCSRSCRETPDSRDDDCAPADG